MKNVRLLIISLLVLGVHIALAASPEIERHMLRANEAYQSGNFAEAMRQYLALAEQGYRSEALYYNLGNACYRLDSVGRAVLYYERALLLDPDDQDITHNLQVIRDQLPDEIDPLPVFFLTAWWRSASLSMPETSWSTLALVALWLGFGGFSLWLLGNQRQLKKVGFAAGIVLLLLSGLFFAFANSRVQLEDDSAREVILAAEVALRSAPDQASEALLELHEGTTLRLLDQIGDWYKIELLDGNQGWLPKSSVAEI